MTDLPRLPTDPSVIEMGEHQAPRECVCGEGADYYVIVTNEAANERLGVDLPPDEWPVNAFLCTQCFRDAPRVGDLEELIEA